MAPVTRILKKLSRREALGMVGAAGAAAMMACGKDTPTSPTADGGSTATTSTSTSTSTSTTTTTTTTTTTAANASCSVTPTETAGPFPSLTDLFRSDIRENKTGTLLTLTIRVLNVASNCAPVTGANVEIWHVDAAGDYSQYGNQTTQTFLRGIQTTNSAGVVTFTTIYPGWYQGRATHIHVEVTVGGRSVKVTQIAFPESISNTVHRSGAYAGRGANPQSNLGDMIFADSLSQELVTPVGDPTSGYSALFQVGVTV